MGRKNKKNTNKGGNPPAQQQASTSKPEAAATPQEAATPAPELPKAAKKDVAELVTQLLESVFTCCFVC